MDNNQIQTYTMEQLVRRRKEREAKRRKKKRRQLIVLIGGIGLVLVIIMAVRGIFRWVEGSRARTKYKEGSYDVTEYVFTPDDPRLVLVNTNRPLAEGYVPAAVTADDSTEQTLEPEAAQAFRDMAQAAAAERIELKLGSGYRDELSQESIFKKNTERYLVQGYSQEEAEAFASTVVGKPTCSEHQTGYAVDIVTSDYPVPDSGFADTKQYAWLVRYAPDYGFILRYPAEREAATGKIHEPWHWRYVGVENARAITASGLSLEEFLALHIAETQQTD